MSSPDQGGPSPPAESNGSDGSGGGTMVTVKSENVPSATTTTVVKTEPVTTSAPAPATTVAAAPPLPQLPTQPIKQEIVMSEMPLGIQLPTQPLPPVQLPTQPVPITAAAQAIAQAAGLPPGTQAAIVEGENGEQQIYIIQAAEGEEVPVEGAEIVVGGVGSTPGGTNGEESVIETVSALEQLSRSGHVVTEGGELLQVYEEVVLPDGTSAKLDESGEVVSTDGVGSLPSSAGVGSLSLPTTPLPPHSLPPSLSSGHTDPVTGQDLHICRICNQFVTADMLATHNATAHGHVQDLTCLDCGKLFKSKRSLFGHRKEKHSGMLEVHSCPECGKSFGRKSNLKAHRESLHYGKKFPCVYCERIFTNRSSMNQHIKKTHQGTAATAAAVAAAAGSGGSLVGEASSPASTTENGEQTVIWHPQTTVINM